MEPGRRFSRTMSGRKATAHFFGCRQGGFSVLCGKDSKNGAVIIVWRRGRKNMSKIPDRIKSGRKKTGTGKINRLCRRNKRTKGEIQMQIIWEEKEIDQLLRLAVLGAYIVTNGGGVCEESWDYEGVKEKLIREYLHAKGAGPALTELQAGVTADRVLEEMRKYLDGYEEQAWQWKLAEKLAEAECPGNMTEERLKRQELYEWVLQERGEKAVSVDVSGFERQGEK